MVQNLCYVFVVVFSSYTYAPQLPAEPLWNNSPLVPLESFQQECSGWLQFHRITTYIRSDYLFNESRAHIRNKSIDREMHVWAAGYVYFITSFCSESLSLVLLTVDHYCKRVNPSAKMTSYLALQNAALTCYDWIHLYGYNTDNQFVLRQHVNSIFAFMKVNIHMALNRDKLNDNDPHYLVAMYSNYLEDMNRELRAKYSNDSMSHIDEVKTPFDFCMLLENTLRSPLKHSFATLVTEKSCPEWIELSGFTNDVGYNIGRALTLNEEVKQYLSKWTIDYIDYILKNHKNNTASVDPEAFCSKNGLFPNVQVFYKKVPENIMKE